jgi:hypothetical protein
LSRATAAAGRGVAQARLAWQDLEQLLTAVDGGVSPGQGSALDVTYATVMDGLRSSLDELALIEAQLETIGKR